MAIAHQLRGEIAHLEQVLVAKKSELARIELRCPHDWSMPMYKPDYIEEYHIPGDPVGTMGIDRQLPMDVPSRTIDKWVRDCKVCGKLEETTQTEVAEIVKRPKFST